MRFGFPPFSPPVISEVWLSPFSPPVISEVWLPPLSLRVMLEEGGATEKKLFRVKTNVRFERWFQQLLGPSGKTELCYVTRGEVTPPPPPPPFIFTADLDDSRSQNESHNCTVIPLPSKSQIVDCNYRFCDAHYLLFSIGTAVGQPQFRWKRFRWKTRNQWKKKVQQPSLKR